MRCKRCRREIENNSIFCNWCGTKQLMESRETKVPAPMNKGNVWFSQVTLGDERVYVSAHSESEYYAKAKAVKAGLIEIEKNRPKNTLGAVIDSFLHDNDSVLSPSTLRSYKSYRKHRFQQFMDSDVEDINWQRMVNEESRKVSPKTVRNAYRLVTASLTHADMPRPTVNLPQNPRNERPWLDYMQIQSFTLDLRGKSYELGALLALNGLRLSEILHLSSDDVDLKNEIIHVRGATVFDSNGKLVDKKTNKNKTSTRDVHIVIPRLTELIRGKDGKLVTMHPSNLYEDINRLCKKLNLPQTGVHGLRHSYASLCYHLKWSEATTMREGGWANTDTVHKIYTHLAAQDANKDIEKMKKFYNRNVAKTLH